MYHIANELLAAKVTKSGIAVLESTCHFHIVLTVLRHLVRIYPGLICLICCINICTICVLTYTNGSSFIHLPQVGDIVYCRLLVANKDMEPEVVCIDGQGRSSGMGVIRNGGFLVRTSLSLVRKYVQVRSETMVVFFIPFFFFLMRKEAELNSDNVTYLFSKPNRY